MSNDLHGLHRAVVVGNADPENRLRLKISAPDVLGEVLPWAEACVPVGLSTLPATGSVVWIMFEAADVNRPVWIGTLPEAVKT